jgi:hypothetical protein
MAGGGRDPVGGQLGGLVDSCRRAGADCGRPEKREIRLSIHSS